VLAGVGARMLIVFAPQVLLYGLAVVLYGILQSHRRFGPPALAPLLSSLVVIGAYAAFGAIGGAYVAGQRLPTLPPLAEYLLSGGTTLGVVALVATAVVPARRLRLGLRPMLRFPPGIGARVRRLALAGVLTLIAQDASVAVVIELSNRYGATGALVIYGFAWAVFMVPYAVLAVPIATSAFPALSAGAGSGASARAGRGARAEAGVGLDAGAGSDAGAGLDAGTAFDATASASTRAVMVACCLGAAALVGARVPVARVFESHYAPGASMLALALAAFAPGLVGYGISAPLSRVLYALGRNRAPAFAVAGGWLLVIAADLVIAALVAPSQVVPALGLGMSFGLTVSGIALLFLVRRERGAAALQGLARAFIAGLAGAVAAAIAGSLVATALSAPGFLANVGVSVLVTAVVIAVFAAVAGSLDSADLRAALVRLRARPS
jgi:putative peptidoglycan lipid II flippase